MDKYAMVDIGTNSIRLLVAETENGNILNSKKILKMTRIGEGVDCTNRISKDAIERSVEAIKYFKEVALKEGIIDISAIATSAVRDAINRDEFTKKVKDELDIDIEVIGGNVEAQLGFKGVTVGIENLAESDEILVIDIGGGSTELIVGNMESIKYQESLNVGAVRMTDKHINNDPVKKEELQNLIKDIRSSISNSLDKIKEYNLNKVIGIGGTITTLGAIDLCLEEYNRDRIHNYVLDINHVNDMIRSFITMNNTQRKELKGLDPKRSDIILSGSMILYEIIKILEVNSITISEYDNLEGLLFSKLIKKV